jgi:hypothetical protein
LGKSSQAGVDLIAQCGRRWLPEEYAMKRFAFRMMVLLTVALSGAAWAEQDKAEQPLRLELDLVDGSLVIGTPGIESVPVQTSDGKMDIPLKQIVAMKIGEDYETASVDLRNGNKVQGVIDLAPIKLDTASGQVSVGINRIRMLHVVLAVGTLPDAFRRGLVLYYSFDRDEDGKVTDGSRKRNDSEVKGAKWTANGMVGGACEMDGRNSQVQRTLVAWIRCDDIPVGELAVPVGFGKSNCYADPNCSGTMFAIGVHCDGGTKTIGMWGVNQGDVWSAARFSVGHWYHVATTFDGRDVRFYLDGRLNVVKEVSLDTPPSPLAIGRIWGDYPTRSRFVGAVDEVMVFNRALTEREIRQICEAQNPYQ